MGRDIKEYKDLTGLLLGPVRQVPAMYLGEAKISRLPNFITGYHMGFYMAKESNAAIDEDFGDGFIAWFFKKYNIPQMSTWHTPFLELANNDEKKALELFFHYLEEYQEEKKLPSTKEDTL